MFFIYTIDVVATKYEIISNWLNKGWKKKLDLIFIDVIEFWKLIVLFNIFVEVVINISI